MLCSGADEPLYLPASQERPCAEIRSRDDYFSSALHEISHWCIAGKARRQRVDFGYWYEPDGRDEQTQALFEKVEVKPQALEWVFSEACGIRFNLSVDNVALPDLKPSLWFKERVLDQATAYLNGALPARGKQFFDALLAHYNTELKFAEGAYLRLDML